MKISKVTASFDADIEAVWRVVTNNEKTDWRSDLSKVEVVDDLHFIEYTKQSFPTYFTITEKKENEVYRFDMENKNLKGKWQGKFFKGEQGKTCVEFIEEITFKNPLLKLAGLFMNIRKIQERYIQDLKNELAAIEGGNKDG